MHAHAFPASLCAAVSVSRSKCHPCSSRSPRVDRVDPDECHGTTASDTAAKQGAIEPRTSQRARGGAVVKCTKVEEQVPWSLQPVLRWQLDFMCFYATVVKGPRLFKHL
ncbi:hypothetical protein C8Q70DRAFT_550737 [Cubamyces menziesii]|nr:hypothetical protein C8Q70DRAFT_550737 [Cubamyces menziesii]